MRQGSRIGILLLTLVLLLGAALPAQAEDCSSYPGGVLDGFAGTPAPSQLSIDRNCTIRNYPGGMSTNFSFNNPGGQNGQEWLVIFDNVVHTGSMSCNAVHDNKIWFVNGSFSGIHENCQNLFIPVEKINKQNPPGQTTAAIGVPFTYSLTIPVLFDPLTGTVIDELGSPNDLHSVTVWDDLNQTGVDLTYLSHVAYWRDTGVPLLPAFTNVSGLLTFEFAPIIIPAGDQIVIEITVVLEDTLTNAPGTSFVNTARWDFGRLIDGVFYEPLPGENGISPPLTIAAPDLVVTKTGPATLGLTLNLGQWGTFGIDVQNIGLTDAFDVTILDRLPDEATGGMCDTTPEILSAQVFAADGVTPVPGKGPLVPGTDFSVSYSGAPSCELTLTMLTPAGVIGPSERLIISYRSKLDADTQDGVALTNVAGATEWFNGDSSNPDRVAFVETLSDGTVGVLDHEDAHTVTAALFGHFFEKSVANLTTGVSPTATAAPGDTLRYTLRLQATDVQLDDLTFFDDLGEMNSSAVFVPGSLALVAGSIPPGADTSNTNPNGGTNGAGILDIRNLNVPANSQVQIQFDITLDPSLTDGTVILNQADLISAGVDIADSDDPNINGQADPSVVGDEDPTQVVIATLPIGPLVKENTQATASVGEPFRYRITVPETPYPFDIFDVQITDDLSASAADLRFVSVSKIAGSQPWTPVNTGTATNLVIEDPAIGIDIPAGEQAVVEITVVLENTPTNAAGLAFTNTASFVYHAIDGNPISRPGDPDTSPPMTVVEPELTLEKSGPATMALGTPATFTLDVQNVGGGPAWNAALTDLLPDTASGGTCDTAPAALTAQVFEADGTTPVSGVLVQGTDYVTSYSGAPGCLFTLTIQSAQGTIGPGQRLIVSYQTELDANTQDGTTLTNIAGAIEWFSFGASSPDRRTYTEVVTDGTVGVLDHEDAHTVTSALPNYLFEKTVANVTSGVSPATTAAPGDVLRYTLRLANTSDVPLADLAFVDDLGSLNAIPVFEPGTLTLVTVPAGADTSGTDPTGGTNGTGLVDVRNLSLPGVGQIVIEFEITLASPLVDGTLVTNQTELLLGGAPFAVSDDPNVNGPADPFVAGDEDPTVVVIQLPPVAPLLKENTQATASVGEPFRYRITVPETPYPFDIYDVQITDDLGASAADLRFLAVTKITGSQPWTPVNTGTDTNLVIEDTSIGIDIPAGEQAVVEITVVLEDTATNVAGLTFTNTASFLYHTIDDDDTSQRPGDPGTSPPMTIVEPELTLEKTGPVQMVPGTPETFTLDVQNAGGGPAWNVTLTDLLPDTANGGTCDTAPAAITAQVFEADGTTPVSGVLVQGTDYVTSYSGAPGCLFTLTIQSAQGTIGPDQRLIVSYQTELDAGSQNGATLTNIAGAVEWFSAAGASPDRRTYTRTVTDGTVGVLDHEDAHTVMVGLASFLFEKTVANVTSGASPATTAAPGDVLRYTLRLANANDVPLNDLAFVDDLGSLNATPVFQPGTLTLVTVPPGADSSGTDPNGGTNGTGLVDVRNLSLPGVGELVIEFEITLASPLPAGTLVTNQTQLLVGGASFALSDDPNVNGPADPFVAGDEDPTVVVIQLPPVTPLLKENTQATAGVGEAFRYRITVPETPYAFPLYDVQILDDLTASAADLRFVSVAKISGSGPWTPVNTGTPTNLVIEDPTIGIDIPAGEQVVVEITVVLENTPTNVAGLPFTNTASFVYRAIDGDPASQLPGPPGTSPPMTVVEPELTLEKTGPAQMTPATPAAFTLDVHNAGGGAAWNLTITDLLPDTPAGGTCDAAPSQVAAQLFQADGVTPVSGPLVAGTDFTVTFSGAPGCVLTLAIVSAAGTIGPDQRLLVSYQTVLDAGSQQGATLTNIAGATGWFSADGASPDRRSYTRTVTDGTVGVLDHEDAHTVTALIDTPVLFASKDVALLVDAGTPNAVDPGDVLRYTIRVTNSGGVPATGVVLSDSVPANTTYVADSTTLNGLPVGQPDGGVSPLLAGIPISSSDLTPPLPGVGAGTISPGETAVLEFDLQVDAGVPGGTVISNQALVASAELPDLPTDGDGDPATGPEPTVVIVSGGQQLLITKQVTVVGGGAALPGSVLEYVVSVQNVALVPANDVVITDDLGATPGQLSYVASSALLNGSSTGVTVVGSLITADYFGSYGPLAPNGTVVLIFQAMLDPGLAAGTTVTNTGVVTWDTPPQTASASVSIDVGGIPGAGALNGRVWHDADFDDALGGSEQVLAGWTVELYRNGALVTSVLTDASGSYQIGGVAPNDVSGDQLELRFRAPGAGANTAALGRAASAFTNGLQQITGIVVASGSNLQDLNLPIDPNGVVYGALSRAPIAGATLTLLAAGGGVPLPSSCLDDPAQQGQVTLGGGHYKFDLNFSDPACPSGGSYLIAIVPPGAGFTAGYSQIIPPISDPSTAPFSVPACPGSVDDALPSPQFCEVQASELAPSAPAGSAGTNYHVHLSLDASQVPGSSQIFNNHIPLDPVLDGAVAISKTTPSLNVSRGQLVPYEIILTNELGSVLPDVSIVDRFPAGFRYIEGSGRIDGIPVAPTQNGQELVWPNVSVEAASRRTLQLLLAVGAGVSEGKYVNRAQAFDGVTGAPVSGEATATVRVVPDPTFSCTDALGKVFDDANRNGVQDAGERGLPGVRLVTARGLAAYTDQHGRFHISCAATPNESRGSNFVLKLDDRTLPSGYRLSTRQTLVQRATQGKALRLNYAASIHRVVALDMADAVFEPGTTEMRLQWRPRLERLIEELEKSPATLRLSYVADVEDADLVERRLRAVEQEIKDAWRSVGSYELTIEPEVFWLRGAPPAKPTARVPGSR